jgi:hypothetical protein
MSSLTQQDRPVATATVAPTPVVAVRQPNPLAQALASLLTKRRRRRHFNLQHMIETRLEVPVFFIVTCTMVIRAAQMFSGGALVMSKLLGSNYAAFEIATGVGLGLGSEMLMTIAGRSWRAWGNELTEIEARPGMSKQTRAAYVRKARETSSWSQRVMFVGMGSSLFAGLSYLFTNSGGGAALSNPAWWGTAFTDLIACAVVTTTVFYLGVLKEARSGQTEAEELLAELDESMNEAVRAAIGRFKDSQQTEKDEKLIAEHLSPSRRAKFLRAVAKANSGRTWTSAELRKRLGLGNDASKVRKLNKQINALASDPDNGLEKAADQRTWLIPVHVVFAEWGEEIAAHDAEELAMRRPAVGGVSDSAVA